MNRKPKKADYSKLKSTADKQRKSQAKALKDAKELAKGTGIKGKGMVKTTGRTVKTNSKLAKKVTAPRKAKAVAATTGTKTSRAKIAVNRKLNNLTGSKTSTLAKRKSAERKIASAKKTATAAKKSAVSATKTGITMAKKSTKTGIKIAKKSTKTGIKMAKTGAGKAKMKKSSLMMKANNLYNKKTGSNTSALKKKAIVKNRIGKAVGNASSSMSSWSAKKKLAMQKLWNRNKK
jgi:RNA polymerase primary sigma factor